MPQSYHGASFGRQVDAMGPVVVCESGPLDIRETSQTGGAAPCVLPIRPRRRVLKRAVVVRPPCVAERFRDSTSIRACTVPKGPLHLAGSQLTFASPSVVTISTSCLHHRPTRRRQIHDSTPTKSVVARAVSTRAPSTFAARLSSRRRQAIQRPPYAADSSRVAVPDR